MSFSTTADDALLLQVYRDNEQALIRFLYKRVQCPHTAADLAQDAYFKLTHAEQRTSIKNLRAYLFSIAANLATDHLRAQVHRTAILDEVSDILWRRDDELTPERIAMGRQRMQALSETVRGMPPLTRRIFYMNRFEGRTYKQIAAELGVSTTTVENHIRRVMQCLREHDDRS